ncbi:MAG: SDR family NAD(P)-dependent oxidoreductase [Hyphomicrobiaceae bacterium]|nr:MAG: SDR family NAD(P)-dependent oxidoreductase [Hyphomicrobiaceae bacterium]
MATPWRTAWITGASTGIGRELALALAGSGVKVAASARTADRLAELAQIAPGVAPLPLDVADRAAMAQAARGIAGTLGPIDLAIFNAGIWEPMSSRNFSSATAGRSMAINYMGVVNGIEAVLPGMIERGSGHIAMVASVAGYRGLPPTAAYGPTKAAVINLAETLRDDFAARGITVTVICPGYVETPMTARNKFPMPFIIPAEDAARRIIRGLAKRKFEIAFPWQLVALMKLGRILPYPLFFWYARTFLAPPRRK